jgi:hypothetical protein
VTDPDSTNGESEDDPRSRAGRREDEHYDIPTVDWLEAPAPAPRIGSRFD